jgi:transposase-like protein
MKIPPGKKLEALIAYWESGERISKVAADSGVSREIIRQWHTLLVGSAEFIYKDNVKHSAEQKLRAVIEYYESGREVHVVAKRFEVSTEAIRLWAKQLSEAAYHVFGNRGTAGEILRLRKANALLSERVLDLEDQIGKYKTARGELEGVGSSIDLESEEEESS